MLNRFRVCVAVALNILILPAVWSQDHADHAEKLESLAFLEGRWNVSVEFRLGAQGPWDSSSGESSIFREVGSKVYREAFAGTREGRPFSSLTLFGVNNLTLDFERIFVDSEHGAFLSSTGSMRGDSLIYDRTWTYPNGNSVLLRTVYVLLSENTFTAQRMRRPDTSRLWDVTGRMTYHRISEDH